jgi:antitoxin HicB
MTVKKKTGEKGKVTTKDYINFYDVVISFDPQDNVYVANVPELPGCMSHGDTNKEALVNAQKAIALYIESLRERGMAIPEPMVLHRYSGKIALRISPTLHRDLACQSKITGTSLNSLIEEKLKRAK